MSNESSGKLKEVRALVKKVRPHQIVRGKAYLFFCIQPSQEEVVFELTLKKKRLNVITVYNYKDDIIGYLVDYKEKPSAINIPKSGEGAALFFSESSENKTPKIAYTDQKLRVLSFDDKAFFVSVKWKSTTTGESRA